MIDPEIFYSSLIYHEINFFTGVPDSLLSELCACIAEKSKNHVTAVNEGNAVALAAGYHLATGKVGAVYMQNSGIGNAVNPLTSLTSKEVYSIPVLLIIGWRGEPGIKDEPQHLLQGSITRDQLDVLNIPYEIIDAESDYQLLIRQMLSIIKQKNAPGALLIRAKTFSSYPREKNTSTAAILREQALEQLLDLSAPSDIFISTTGKTSRELYELRSRRGEEQHDFLTVGSMGHSSSIALGVALHKPDRRVICLDGDGSLLMHMGSLAATGKTKPENFIHVLLNNGAHESVGGQPTAYPELEVGTVALASGYRAYFAVENVESLRDVWENIVKEKGPILLEIKIAVGSRKDLGRPVSSPQQNKQNCMSFIRNIS
ncbi:MAG: phosphonopyruvate decarboxylase [Spirochaetia bacterium]|nr:phosphonopyruvate decarboxylase [Spirochaetia bacterium]